MRRPTWKVKEKVAPLEVEVVPEVDANPFTDLEVNPFADMVVNPFADLITNPFADTADGIMFAPETLYPGMRAAKRYAAADCLEKESEKSDPTRVVIIIPPLRTEGQLIWLSSSDYERCFEEWEPGDVWPRGFLIDFDEAVESMQYLGYGDDDESENLRLYAITCSSEQDTFQADEWWFEEPGSQVELMELALPLRAKLVKDPEAVAAVLNASGLRYLKKMAGLDQVPTTDEVTAAIISDPTSGLGGAAVDHVLWYLPDKFTNGLQLAELMDKKVQTEYVRVDPVESFLLYTGSLHPGTVGQPHAYTKEMVYPMKGSYVVSKISYTSDLTGTVVGGWRSCWLEPEH